MVSIRFTSFVLVLIFILLHGRDSIAHTPQDGNGPEAAGGRSNLTVEKENNDGVPATAEVTNKRLGGRKMKLKMDLGEEIMVKEEGLNGETPKITGNDTYALKNPLGTSQEHLNYQNDRSTLKAKSLNSASPETSGKRPVDLPNELVNLMNKDYQGSDGNPPHKPPINNGEPLNQEHVIP